MYALSWIFLAAAIAALAFGLTQQGLTFIYVSIGASVVAMLFLLAGVLRKRPLRPATAGAPYGPPPEEAARGPEPALAVTTAEDRTEVLEGESRPSTPEPSARPQRKPPARRPAAEAAPEPAAPAKKSAARKPSAKKTSAKKAPAKKTAAKSTAAASTSTRSQVVALPERGTYHLADCRIVKGRTDTEKITRSTATRRGYSACGICKPAA